MVTLKHGTATYTIQPENEEKVLAKLGKLTKRSFKTPFTHPGRKFPAFISGMSTAEYLKKHAALNGTHSTLSEDCVDPERLEQPAPEYDPNIPLCVEGEEAE